MLRIEFEPVKVWQGCRKAPSKAPSRALYQPALCMQGNAREGMALYGTQPAAKRQGFGLDREN